MRAAPQIRWLPDGRRLHLQDGPIDLIVQAFGTEHAVRSAAVAAARRFATVLDELCAELPQLRAEVRPGRPALHGVIAAAMARAVAPHAPHGFITPMAAVAGAVADAVLSAMTRAADLDRAYVNNGGDIALHLAPNATFRIGMVDRPDAPDLFGDVTIGAEDAVRGIATSGWRGRSFSRGIAEAVTVLARSAAEADAAATVIANAVDLPGHTAVRRTPASTLQPDSDLGDLFVTCDVGALDADEIATALDRGLRTARRLADRGLIIGAALHLQGMTRLCGAFAGRRPPNGVGAPFLEPAHA